MRSGKKVVGLYEKVGFPTFDMQNVVAKIDTGAFTGALHCTQIDIVETPTGKRLRFSPFDHPEKVILTSDYRKINITRANVKDEKRYAIQTYIILKGEKYPITLSLADRSAMRWPVLIGRKFIRTNNFLVDVKKGIKYAQAVKDKQVSK